MNKLNYFLYISIILLFGIIFCLKKTNRIIIPFLYHSSSYKNDIIKKDFTQKCLYINSYNEEKSVNITLDKYNKNFYYDYLNKFSKFIFEETNGDLIIKINNISFGINNIILNTEINSKNITNSILNEFNLQKSLFLAIKSILPSMETLYFFNNNNPFKFNHLMPFFTQTNLNKDDINNDFNNERIHLKDNLCILPLIIKNGNLINGTYEKAIFSKIKSNPEEDCLKNKIIIPKNDIYTKEWIDEVNLLESDIVIGTIIKNSEKNSIAIFIPETTAPYLGIKEISECKINKISLLNDLQKEIISNIIVFAKKNNIDIYLYKVQHKISFCINKPLFIIELSIKNKFFINNLIHFLIKNN